MLHTTTELLASDSVKHRQQRLSERVLAELRCELCIEPSTLAGSVAGEASYYKHAGLFCWPQSGWHQVITRLIVILISL